MKIYLATMHKKGLSTHRRAMIGRFHDKIAHICNLAILRKRLFICSLSKEEKIVI